jgi:hypothetical protein
MDFGFYKLHLPAEKFPVLSQEQKFFLEPDTSVNNYFKKRKTSRANPENSKAASELLLLTSRYCEFGGKETAASH